MVPNAPFTYLLKTVIPLLRFSDVFRRQEKGALGTKELTGNMMFSRVLYPMAKKCTIFHDGGSYHVEISALICTGFCMIGTSFMKELNCKKAMELAQS